MFAFAQHFRNLAAVDKAIRSGEHPNANSIGVDIGVHPRTVHRYFDFLREHLKAPLEFVPSENGFRYSRKWSFDKATINWIHSESDVLDARKKESAE